MRILTLFLALCACTFVHADSDTEGGFLTGMLNTYLQKKADEVGTDSVSGKKKMKYGRKVTDYVSVPEFSGYVIGKYGYTSKEGVSPNNMFELRLARFTITGTILRDFNYRVHFELKGGNPLRDAYLEWRHWPELAVRAGQFKRCFTFENALAPWDVGFGGYSQMQKHMLAMTDYGVCGEPAQNGRDLGVMLQGDVLPVGTTRHRLFRYQAAVFNGNGQNNRDNNSQKDYIGNFQVQPIPRLYVGLFGWTGTYTGANGVSVSRNRWSLGAIYDYKDWTFRAEYAHHSGYSCTNYDPLTGTFFGPHEADGWQATVGAPCTKWLKIWLRYDAFRYSATWGSLRTIYSIAPNFDLHKNIKLQVQYNYTHDQTFPQHPDYHELWTEIYVRY